MNWGTVKKDLEIAVNVHRFLSYIIWCLELLLEGNRTGSFWLEFLDEINMFHDFSCYCNLFIRNYGLKESVSSCHGCDGEQMDHSGKGTPVEGHVSLGC